MLISESGIVKTRSREDLMYWYFCMKHAPRHLLTNASHDWAMEVAIAGEGTWLSDDIHSRMEWIFSRLHNYFRRHPIKDIKEAIPRILDHKDLFDNLDLNEAITSYKECGIPTTKLTLGTNTVISVPEVRGNKLAREDDAVWIFPLEISPMGQECRDAENLRFPIFPVP
jgi:hypothetical protein